MVSLKLTSSLLYDHKGLYQLDKAFGQFLKKTASSLYPLYSQIRKNSPLLEEKDESSLLLELAPLLEDFLLELFSLRKEYLPLQKKIHAVDPFFLCRRQFVQRFAAKRYTLEEVKNLTEQEVLIPLEKSLKAPFSEDLFIQKVLYWLEEPILYKNELEQAAWYTCWALYSAQGQKKHVASFLFHLPQKTNHMALLRKIQKTGEFFSAEQTLSLHRDGFSLTDPGPTLEKALSEAAYCILCHNQGRDSCSKGLPEKETDNFQKNPLGVPLSGCPLKEKISEMNTLIRQGHMLGALAVVCIDNPLVAATGHRICNDCKNACIFQKQDPVDVPAIESALLKNVLALPFGFEIYSLLTRWNPLNFKRPLPKSPSNYKILVVGQGPAGFTLAHHLIQEGHTVVAIDGLKIEPLPASFSSLELIQDTSSLFSNLEDRQVAGFGGVMEYGITSRWDKNLLLLIRLLLERRTPFYTLIGSIRFGTQFTEAMAIQEGFDHIALCTGTGKPHFLPLAHAFAKGIHFASDFLMSLQLSGAFQKSSPIPFLIRLPLVVIGGGLTACDAATEALAYYPRQVEKFLNWYENLISLHGQKEIEKTWSKEDHIIAQEFIEHAKALRTERQKALKEHRPVSFLPLLQQWGGVTLIYRNSIEKSRAYSLNHEELQHTLQEGVYFLENRKPLSIQTDELGWIKEIILQSSSGENGSIPFPTKSLLWAIGTDPNTSIFRQQEISIPFDITLSAQEYLHSLLQYPSSVLLNAKSTISYSILGDLHPIFSGSVVKAMASGTYGAFEISETLKKHPSRSLQKAIFFSSRIKKLFTTHVLRIDTIAPKILEIHLKAPAAAKSFQPGQFFRFQQFNTHKPSTHTMEGIALTGALSNPKKGTLSLIVLQNGASTLLCKNLQKGEKVSLMGPTGTPTYIPLHENVLLIGGGLGNAVLFSIGQAMRAKGCRVLYIAGYRDTSLVFKKKELEEAADQILWCFEKSPKTAFRIRPQDICFEGKVTDALQALSTNTLSVLRDLIFNATFVQRILTIGPDGMMHAVHDLLQSPIGKDFTSCTEKIASINSPMQCMLKEICGQCLQRHQDPITGLETFVFSCTNQDQPLEQVDFSFLKNRLDQNSLLEKTVKHLLDYAN